MKRLFKEFILGKGLAHVLFEREVKKLFDEFHQKWRDEHWDNPCKGMTLRMFTGFIKKEGIIITAARRKDFKPRKYKHPIYEGIGFKMSRSDA